MSSSREPPTKINFGTAAPEPRPTRDYLAALWSKIKEKVGDGISREDFDAAHRSAMSSAGGKASAKSKAARKQQTASEFRAHAERHPEPVAGCDICYDGYRSEVVKLPKQDDRVSYRDSELAADDQGRVVAAAGVAHCGGCRFYQWGSCALVEGSIEADDVCDLYLPPVNTYVLGPSLYTAADAHGGAWRLFNSLNQAFADAPEWVNILPKPGSYSHPSYGTISISQERNARFVSNFDERVYNQDLPITIDIEHDGKMSGAVGYFEELRINGDGSVDARVAWNDRGKTLIEEDAFKYFSPEWWEEWTDPATRKVYQDVLIGGAICVRPFFKEGALRPLVASEHRMVAAGDVSTDRTTIWMQPVAAVQQKEAPRVSKIELTEEEVQAFREAQGKVAALEAQLTAEAEARQASEARVASLESDARRKRFTDMARGKGGEDDGAPWAGKIDETVADLIALAEVVGEDSDVFKNHIARNREIAKTLKESLKPIGTSEPGAGDGESDEIERKARTLMAAEPTLTYGDAVGRVFAENPDMYDAHRRASFSRVATDND
jgi:hypothetical protein